MFYHVRGKLIHVEEGMAAVECAGVAFALKTTNNTLSKLPALQSEVTLYTYFLVRERERWSCMVFTTRGS